MTRRIVWGYGRSWIAYHVQDGAVVWESRWHTSRELAEHAQPR